MTTVNAWSIVGAGLPQEDGAKLAQFVISHLSTKDELTIDLRDCQARLLISAFFNSFLQTVDSNDLLDEAKKIKWTTKHEFQLENVSRWMKEFKGKKMAKTADVKAENDTDCLSVMEQVNKALLPYGLTFKYDDDKYWENVCACAWQLKPTESALSIAGMIADKVTQCMLQRRDAKTLDMVSKFLSISTIVGAYQHRIIEFGIFPMNKSYPNGTMMACHSVEMQFQIQPPLEADEIPNFTNAGFRVFKSEIIDDATAAVIEMNWA